MVSTQAYTLEYSTYDIIFTKKAIEYFSNTYNCPSNILSSEENKSKVFELKKNGAYRTELIFTLKMCCEKNIDINTILNSMNKDKKSVFDIAKEYNYNVIENFNRSKKIKESIEKEIDDKGLTKVLIEKYFK